MVQKVMNINKGKVAFLTLGCKVNTYETNAMETLFQNAGYELVGFSEEADIYIVNTCTVTNMADRKSRQMLHKAKKKNPNAIVVADLCLLLDCCCIIWVCLKFNIIIYIST